MTKQLYAIYGENKRIKTGKIRVIGTTSANKKDLKQEIKKLKSSDKKLGTKEKYSYYIMKVSDFS